MAAPTPGYDVGAGRGAGPEEAAEHLSGPDHADRTALLDLEHDNMRAAADWAAEHDPGAALRPAAALWRFWQVRGHLDEGRRRLLAVLDLPVGEDGARAWATYGAAVICSLLREATARARRETSDADYRCWHVLGRATDIRLGG